MSDARAWVAGFVEDSVRCRAAIGARTPPFTIPATDVVTGILDPRK